MPSITSSTWLVESLNRVRGVRAAVFGDFRLEAWWTTHQPAAAQPLPVTAQAYGLGEAARIAANLADLGAQAVHAVGLVGDDMFGHQLLQLLTRRGINTDTLVRGPESWPTSVRARYGPATGEQQEFVFEPSGEPDGATLARLAQALERVAGWCDVVVLCPSMSLPEPAEQIVALAGGARAGRFLVAAGGRDQVLPGAATVLADASIDNFADAPTTDRHDVLREIHSRSQQPAFLVGDDFAMACDGAALHETTSADLQLTPGGGGDAWAATAAVAALRGAGLDPVACSRVAVLASNVAAADAASPTPTAPAAQIRQRVGRD